MAAVLAALLAVMLLMLIGVVAAIFGLKPLNVSSYRASVLARAEIPPANLRLYEQAGARYGIDPWILAAVGWVETMHGRSLAPGVRSGVNAFRVLRRADAVQRAQCAAVDVGQLRRRRQPRRQDEPVRSRGRDPRCGALPRGQRRPG
jgi:hypothetical protein